MEGSAPPKKDGVCSVGDGLSTDIMVAIPAVLSSEPQTQVFPHTTLVYSALLLLEPRVRGCKLDFVHWPFKRVSVSLA